VIKEAFAAKIITDGQVWVDMMLHRNLLSHIRLLKISRGPGCHCGTLLVRTGTTVMIGSWKNEWSCDRA